MKTILHPDYWVEIPAGEFLIGLSDEQRDALRSRLYTWAKDEQFSITERQLLVQILVKYRHRAERILKRELRIGAERILLTDEEQKIEERAPFDTILDFEHMLFYLPQLQPVWLERFYIARYPLIEFQKHTIPDGTPPANLPGLFEAPPEHRQVAAVTGDDVLWLCQELGVRLPTTLEWTKAARGTDGRLYPWGNEWDWEAGDFCYGQPGTYGRRADVYPRGKSPYGVSGMVGGLPELALNVTPRPSSMARMGCHARDSSAERAWLDHLLIWQKGGRWVSLRPALSQWPKRQWSGFWTEAKGREGPPLTLDLTVGVPQIKLEVITAENVTRLKPLSKLVANEQQDAKSERVNKLVWLPGGQQVGIVSGKLWLYQVDALNGDNQRPTIRANYRRDMAYSQDGRLLVAGGLLRKIQIWNRETDEEQLVEATELAQSLAVHPTGKILALGDDLGNINLWQIDPWRQHQTLVGHTAPINKLLYSQDGRTLISACADHTIRFWDGETGEVLQILNQHTQPVYDIVFSPEGSLLASASGDGTVRFWDAVTGAERQVLAASNGNVIASLTFSPDGKLLVTGQGNGTITVWQVDTSDIITVTPCYGEWISSAWVVKVAFSPDGTMLATYNRGAVLWGIPATA